MRPAPAGFLVAAPGRLRAQGRVRAGARARAGRVGGAVGVGRVGAAAGLLLEGEPGEHGEDRSGGAVPGRDVRGAGRILR